MKSNVRTMKLIMEDDWGNEVYKCVESGVLYKNIEMRGFEPKLCTCGNSIYGELCSLIDTKNIELHFIKAEDQPTEKEKFNYMLLSRLKMDCEYYLNYGSHCKKYLWAVDEKNK